MIPRLLNRCPFLRSAAAGSLGFPGIVEQFLADSADPHAPKMPPYPAKAKNVISLFMTGVVSHVESDAMRTTCGLLRLQTTGFGWPCLASCCLIERGVRFVKLIDTGSARFKRFIQTEPNAS